MFKGRTPAVGSWWKMACVHGPYLLPLRVCSGTSRWIVENGENPTWYQVCVYIYGLLPVDWVGDRLTFY